MVLCCPPQVLDAALADPTCVSPALLQFVARRTSDKKEAIMKDTIARLCQLFRTHCLEYWRQGRELPDTSRRFLFIPKRLMASCTQDSFRSVLVVEECLDEIMLDKKFTAEERTRCFIGFYASLDAKSQVVLTSKVFVPKWAAQATVQKLLALREAGKQAGGGGGGMADMQQAMREAAVRLARYGAPNLFIIH